MADERPPPPPPEPAPPPPEDGEGLDAWVAVLLAVAALVAAALGGRAALLADRGSDTYSAAIRQHAKRAAATVEDIRYVYDDQATFTLRAVVAELRAEMLRDQARKASGALRRDLLDEAEAQEQVAEIAAGASEAAVPEYRLPGGGYDLAASLAAQRARYPDLVGIEPDEPEEEGAELTTHSALAIAATVPVSLAFMFGALSQAFPSRRRVFLILGAVFLLAGAGLGIAWEVVL